MISQADLQRLLDRPESERPIVSLFLDMSVNNNNKRTYNVFLQQRRSEFVELESDRENHHREEIAAFFERVDEWLGSEYNEVNEAVVIYGELGGDWFEALQFPVPVMNRLVISSRPAVGPLAQVLESAHHHAVVLVDKEHFRILSVFLGEVLEEREVQPEHIIPTQHHVQAGGYSQSRFQRRKREEMKHFFKDFIEELEEVVRRYRPDDVVVLGTEENTAAFQRMMPEHLAKMVVFTGHMGSREPSATVLERIEPHLQQLREQEGQELLHQLQERAQTGYLATAGVGATIAALQEGKVDSLFVQRDQTRAGKRCRQCGYLYDGNARSCIYDETTDFEEIDIAEEMVRMAEAQDAHVEFVAPGDLDAMNGVGALLRR